MTNRPKDRWVHLYPGYVSFVNDMGLSRATSLPIKTESELSAWMDAITDAERADWSDTFKTAYAAASRDALPGKWPSATSEVVGAILLTILAPFSAVLPFALLYGVIGPLEKIVVNPNRSFLEELLTTLHAGIFFSFLHLVAYARLFFVAVPLLWFANLVQYDLLKRWFRDRRPVRWIIAFLLAGFLYAGIGYSAHPFQHRSVIRNSLWG